MDPYATPQAQVVWEAANAFVVRLQWRDAREHADRSMFQALRFREDKIREMADYRDIRAATKTAKRFTVQNAD